MNAPTVYTNSNNATLGHKCFLTLQTIYTNWERRLAVRADNDFHTDKNFNITKIASEPFSGI